MYTVAYTVVVIEGHTGVGAGCALPASLTQLRSLYAMTLNRDACWCAVSCEVLDHNNSTRSHGHRMHSNVIDCMAIHASAVL